MAKKKTTTRIQSVQGAAKAIRGNKSRTQSQLDAIFGSQTRKKSK